MNKLSVLIVEDEFLIAMQLERAVSRLDCDVVGPAAYLAEALAMIDRGGVDAALLDVSLRHGEKVYPAADELSRRNIPFAFITAYGRDGLDPAYTDRTVICKPLTDDAVRQFLAGVQAS
jgi:CheY-like chemotaxis protein